MNRIIKFITILIVLLILFINPINSYAVDNSLDDVQLMIDYYPRKINTTIKNVIIILLVILLVLNLIIKQNKIKKIITTILGSIFGTLSLYMMEYFHYGPENGRINRLGDKIYIIVTICLLINIIISIIINILKKRKQK